MTATNPRSQPVVAVVGHIDHGKTTLLDYIRKSQVADKEAGGITQRISAYEITHTTKEGATRAITFIDTPGHEAFQKMRRRGAGAADIAILVVAADDGVKPQTKEAWAAIQNAKVPAIVAFTKIDKETANLERAKESVGKEGIYLEGLGGEIPWVGVSGKSGDGVPELLDLIILAADLNGVTCDAASGARAIVMERARDARTGVSATVIVRVCTLASGTFAVALDAWAPVRVLENAAGEKGKEIVCGKPARLSGFSKEPAVGSEIIIVESKKEAEQLVKDAFTQSQTAVTAEGDAGKTPIRIVLKADTAGSIEALEYELGKVPREYADLVVVASSIGAVSENDVKLLVGFPNTIVLGFNVKVDAVAKDLAERQGIIIETSDIIYKLTEWLAAEVVRMAPPPITDTILGAAKILKHFSTAGQKHVIGGRVESGVVKRGNTVTIIRRDIVVGQGKIVNLQSSRADVTEVEEGKEFGAQIESKFDIIAGDMVEVRVGKA